MKDMERLVRKINNLERIVRSLKAEGSAGQISSDTSVYQLDFTHQHPLSGISNLSKLAGTLLTYSSEVLSVDEASIDHGSIAGLADEDHSLSAIANTTGDKTFTFANKGIKFLFTGVNPGAYDGMFELEMTGNLQADIMHIHQHTGNVVAGSKLLHLHGEDSDLLELEISGIGKVLSIQDTGDSDEELLAFDTTARTLRIGAADGDDDIAVSIFGQIVAFDGFGAIDVNFANGTTYKIEADGDAFFKEIQSSPGNLPVTMGLNHLSFNRVGTSYINQYAAGSIAIRVDNLDTNKTCVTFNSDGSTTFGSYDVNLPTKNLLMGTTADSRIRVPYLAAVPGSADNGSVWMEADGLHIYYNGAEKVVAGA